LYKQYLNNQAGRLAQKLVENQPCPVCGSTVHPNPAHQAEVVTDTELEGAKKAADKASKDCSEKSRLSGESEATYNAGAAKVLENAATLLDTPNISLDNINTELVKALTELTAKEGELKVRVSKLTTDCNKLERLNKAIPELEKELNSATEQINELNISLTQNSGHLANVNKDVEDLVNTLDYDSLDAAQAQINKLTSLVKAKTDTIEQANNKINKLNIDKSSLSGTIKSQQDDLKDVPQTDISAENEKLNKLNLQYKEVNAKKDSINSMLSFNKLTLEKLQEKNKALLVTQADIQMLAPLEQIASGKDNTDGKIDLETYVQLAYFDKVITKANLRFQELSDGHYYLRRSNELSKKSQGGLDLDIMDRYTDSVRAVKTLSGGESFMASLSLALGLSDVIQESAGGVHLDTLFIDEGFGTLSDNSLNQAMNVLNTLGNSNKLVGIISHIDTLKKRIGKQIVVTKDSKGRSHAKIVCDE
jgi:exonuclease SbcC